MQRAATMPEVPWGTPALEEQRRGSPAERAAVERAPSGALSAEDQNGPEDDDSDISDHQRHRERPKRGMLQGRFSGRLLSKSCEKSLAAECKLLGPLLGGVGKRGERSRMTLAKIVRAVAAGDVRRFCEEREGLIQELEQRRADEGSVVRQGLDRLERENAALRTEIDRFKATPRPAPAQPSVPQPTTLEAPPEEPQSSLKLSACTPATSASNALVCTSTGLTSTSPDKAPGPPASLPFELAPGSQLPVLPSSSHHFDAAPTRSLSLLSAPALNSQASGQLAQAPALPMALPSLQGLEDSSEAQAFAKEAAQLQKFAQNLKAHASSWAAQSQTAYLGRPVKMQAACQAQSFQAKAASLEKAAEAQTLQAQAVVHAQAQAEAHAQARDFVNQANHHAKAHAQASLRADRLQREQGDSKHAAAEKQQLDRQAHEHAQAQTQLVTAANSLAKKATAHMHAQVSAQQQAHAAAAEAHHYDAHAQALQAEAAAVAGPLGPAILPPEPPDPLLGMAQASGAPGGPVAASLPPMPVLPISGASITREGMLSPRVLASPKALQSNVLLGNASPMQMHAQLGMVPPSPLTLHPLLTAGHAPAPHPETAAVQHTGFAAPQMGSTTTLRPLDTPTIQSVLHGIELPDVGAVANMGLQRPASSEIPTSMSGMDVVLPDPLDQLFNGHGSLHAQVHLPPVPASPPSLPVSMWASLGFPGNCLSMMPTHRMASMSSALHADDKLAPSQMRLVSGT